MISAEAKAERERLFARRTSERPELSVWRRQWEAEAGREVLPRGARFSRADSDDVPAEWMDAPGIWKDRVLLHFHGGGFSAGSPRTHRRLAADLSRTTHLRVLVPEYRLAPEHPYPAALRDALVIYRWLATQGFTERQIVLSGDSAGGGLVLQLLVALRDAGAPMPLAAVLLSPWTDLSCSSQSHAKLRKYDPVIERDRLVEAGMQYARGRNPADPRLSPLFADLTGLPPLLIHVGEDETLLDDSRLLAERARGQGVEAMLKVFPGMWHVFHASGTVVPEARLAIDEVGAFVRSLFNAEGMERLAGE